MSNTIVSEEAKAVVRRSTEEVQSQGNFAVFEELFADDFVDHTVQPGTTPDKAGVRKLYTYLRAAFPDFHAEIHWQAADGDRITTFKTYHGTHKGTFLGIAPTNRRIQFESVDVMRVQNGKITEHWGVGNLLSLIQQIGGWEIATTPKGNGTTPFQVDAIDHIVVNVDDVDASAVWYARILGMIRSDSVDAPGKPSRTSMKFGTQKINLRPITASRGEWTTADRAATGSDDLCFLTRSSPEIVLSHLRACSIRVELGPVSRTGAKGQMTSVYCRDPDGNLVEIASYGI
jgi:steroid delta-isomerase-like uncharacterized protein